MTDSDKHLNPLDKIEKAEYTQQIEKIAYAMTFPPVGSGENVKIKVMDYIESECFYDVLYCWKLCNHIFVILNVCYNATICIGSTLLA